MAKPGAFGPVAFETSAKFIRTFKELHERRQARYATHDVLDLNQLLQFVGVDLAEIEFTMEFHHAFCVPQDELEKLRNVLKEHKVHVLIIGGHNLGEMVLEEIKADWNHVSGQGQILHAGAQVRLKEYR
jgi:phage protein U